MSIAIAVAVSLLVGFAAGMIFKSKIVAKEQAAQAAFKASATKLVNKL